MAFPKGKSGNPGGRDKEKIFADALCLVVSRDDDDGKKKLYRITEKLVECALAGEGWAIQQVADRLDGKAAQESTVTIDDKRDAADWNRTELVSLLTDARESSAGTSKANGRLGKSNQIH